MRYALLALALLATPTQAGVDWKEHPYDKATHIAIGGALSCAISAKTDKPWLGVLAALLVGTAKEATDTNFDKADLASWGAGGALGALCVRF
jgi:hypothetical protein